MRSSAFKYFQEVARQGSIRRASDKLNVAASALSRQITLLEHEVGMPLLERYARGVRLTEAGRIVSNHLKKSLLDEEYVLGMIDDLRGARRGTIKMAVIEGVMTGPLPAIISTFRSQHAGVTLIAIVTGADHCTDLLREDEADLAVVYEPRDKSGLELVAELASPFCAVVHRAHPLAGRKTLSLSELANYPLILYDHSYSGRSLVERAARRAKMVLTPAITVNSIEGAKALVREGTGIAFLPEFAVTEPRDAASLRPIPLSDAAFRNCRLLLLTKRRRSLTPSSQRMVLCIAEQLFPAHVSRPAPRGSRRVRATGASA